MDPATSVCPTCGTPRGHYDRFCTVCGEDLGAPGAAMGVMIQGSALPATSSGAARQRMTSPTERTFARSVGPAVGRPSPGPNARYSAVRALGAPVAADGRTFAQINPSTYRAQTGADQRLWRTIAITNRLLVVMWLTFYALGTAITVGQGSDRVSLGTYLASFLLAGLLPAVLVWIAAGRLESGSPAILRPLALLEIVALVPLTFGLILVPLVVIYLVSGRPETS